MRIICQLYDPDGHGCGAFIEDCETIEELVRFLDEVSDNGYYTYEIGIDELTRRKDSD